MELKVKLATPPIIGLGYVVDMLNSSLPYRQEDIYSPCSDNTAMPLVVIADPVHWLHSMWLVAKVSNHKHVAKVPSIESLLPEAAKCDTFETFMVRYIIAGKSVLSSIIEEYAAKVASTYIRVEDLPGALHEIIWMLGYHPTPSLFPPSFHASVDINDNLKRKLRYVERVFCAEFDY